MNPKLDAVIGKLFKYIVVPREDGFHFKVTMDYMLDRTLNRSSTSSTMAPPDGG